MKTLLQARTNGQPRVNGMRVFVPLAMMIVPGAAYAQPLEQAEPATATATALPAPWIAEAATAPLRVDATAPLALFDLSAPTAEAQAAPAEAALPAMILTEAAADAAEADLQPIAIATALTSLALADAALAQAAPSPINPADAVLLASDAAEAVDTTPAPVALADQADALFATAPVSENELAESTGKALDNPMVAMANSSSNVNNNYVGANSTTGTVNISDTAFQGSSGFAMVNINTGNASSIIGTMSVNVQINYAPMGQ